MIGAAFDRAAFPETFLLGDVRLDLDRRQGASIYLHGNQILLMVSLPDEARRIGVALPPGDPIAESGRQAMTAERNRCAIGPQEGLERLQELFTAYSGDAKTRMFDPTWFSVFRINRRTASTFRGRRLLIAGDPAHLSSPLGAGNEFGAR